VISNLLRAMHPRNWIIEGVVVTILVVVGMNTLSGWRTADRANDFPIPLLSLPSASPSLTDQTAPELQQLRPQRFLNVSIRYVSASNTSSGPYVVSVHPIDTTTWAAVALGPDGRCYGTLTEEQSPADGQTYYAKFPTGTPCRGKIANQWNVTNTEVPS